MSMRSAEFEWLLGATSSDTTGFYEAIGVAFSHTLSEEAAVHCFANPEAHVNGDRKASCSINVLTGLWHCKGCGVSGNAYQAALAMGRPELQARELAKRYGLFLEVEREKPKLPNERDLKKWRQRLVDSPLIIARLGEVKGWTLKAMVRCGLGWDGERVTFPIRTSKLKIAGVVRYVPGGSPKSLAVQGSKRLLFPAPEVISRKRPLFIVEGEPDAVSVWSCGHQAVAIPGVSSWRLDWALRLHGRRVVVVPDCDAQGRELAGKVLREVPNSSLGELAAWRSDGMDIGDLVLEAAQAGALKEMKGLLGAMV